MAEKKYTEAEYDEFKRSLKEIPDDDLKKVVGGMIEGTSDTWFHGTYICPLCSKKHEFIAEPLSGFANAIGELGKISSSNACGKTDYLGVMGESFLYSNTGTIEVRDRNNKPHYSTYTLDYLFCSGTLLDLNEYYNRFK